MNSQINLSNKKKIFTISSILKSSNDKKYFSSRSNTQEMLQYNHSKNKSSSCKNRKNKNNNSLYNNKNEELPKKFTGITNISTKINSDKNSKANMAKNENKNLNVYQYKELINIKDKKIAELEKLIKIYREKLKNQIRVFNINTSINSFNLSKTRSSTNITERNMYKIRSLSNSQAKIKTSYPPTKNIYGNNKIVNNKMNYNTNKSKKRPKTKNYKRPKMNNYFCGIKILIMKYILIILKEMKLLVNKNIKIKIMTIIPNIKGLGHLILKKIEKIIIWLNHAQIIILIILIKMKIY